MRTYRCVGPGKIPCDEDHETFFSAVIPGVIAAGSDAYAEGPVDVAKDDMAECDFWNDSVRDVTSRLGRLCRAARYSKYAASRSALAA